jgi:hypothetical protein
LLPFRLPEDAEWHGQILSIRSGHAVLRSLSQGGKGGIAAWIFFNLFEPCVIFTTCLTFLVSATVGRDFFAAMSRNDNRGATNAATHSNGRGGDLRDFFHRRHWSYPG